MEFFINSKIFPKKIFYLSPKKIENPLFYKIDYNELDITYNNKAVIIVDLINISPSRKLIKKLKNIEKLVVLSIKNIYFELFDMDYIYSNPFFKNEIMRYRNKTLENYFTKICLKENEVYTRTIHTKFKENNSLEYSLDNSLEFTYENEVEDDDLLIFC